MRNMSEKTRGKKTKREIVGTIILCIMVLFSLLISVQIVVRGYANIFGFSFFRVVTGSMEPTLPVGSILLCRSEAIEDIEADDIVCFRSQESGFTKVKPAPPSFSSACVFSSASSIIRRISGIARS